MKITIISEQPITDKTKNKIKDIFMQSECPNESLGSVSGFSRLDGNIVCLGVKGGYVEEVEI